MINKLILKQSIKYFLIIMVFLFGIALSRILWNQTLNFQWWLFGITGTIIVISVIVDLISVKDIIPIFKR